MVFDADDKVRLAHLALTQAVTAECLQHTYTTPIDTSVPRSALDRSTPQAQTRYDYEDDLKRRSARMSVNLAGMWSTKKQISLTDFCRHRRIRR